MAQGQQKIMCTVQNCNYWAQGNECHASQILVTSNSFADAQPDSFDALQASTAPQTPVATCMDTCCKTFVGKGSRDARADKITRI